MSSETIFVYIDPAQLDTLTQNNFSLYLAKKVKDAFTVIWQSKGPLPVAGKESYSYENKFDIAIPSFQINWGSVTETDGVVSYSAGGKATSISVGQVTTLKPEGLFTAPVNGGSDGTIIIENNRQNFPRPILSDSSGNAIYVATDSGMAIGETKLTPIDEYQLWFGTYQDTGSIIAESVSNPKIVTFDGTSQTQTVSYTENGKWIDGNLPATQYEIDADSQVEQTSLAVLATMSLALTTVAVTYITSKLIDKFSSDLKPTDITVQKGDTVVRINFAPKKDKLGIVDTADYIGAVNKALTSAKADPKSPIAKETWKLSEPKLTVFF